MGLSRASCKTGRPSSASSAWDTSGFRSPSRWRSPATGSSAWRSPPRRPPRSTPGAATSPTCPPRSSRARRRGAARGDLRLLAGARVRRDRHLRPHAAQRDEGARHLLHGVGGPHDRAAPARGRARDARVHDLSRYHRGDRAADSRDERAQGRRRPVARVLAERVDPGNPVYQTRNTPKVVGGVTPRCTEEAVAFYGRFIDTIVPVSSTRAAEMTKLLENIFRCVNIALMNELLQVSERMGINIWEVVDAAKTKPFGFMPFQPGPGLGGHCIPIDPFYLAWKAREFDMHTEFIELAGKTNEAMPYYVVQRLMNALNDSPQVARRLARPDARRGVQGQHRRHARVPGHQDRGPAARQGSRRRLPRPVRPSASRSMASKSPSVELTAEEVAVGGCGAPDHRPQQRRLRAGRALGEADPRHPQRAAGVRRRQGGAALA